MKSVPAYNITDNRVVITIGSAAFIKITVIRLSQDQFHIKVTLFELHSVYHT
jgi:hypothetical protein